MVNLHERHGGEREAGLPGSLPRLCAKQHREMDRKMDLRGLPSSSPCSVTDLLCDLRQDAPSSCAWVSPHLNRRGTASASLRGGGKDEIT